MLGECQDALDVELRFLGGAQLHLAQRELFTLMITLTLVGVPVDRRLVEECFVDTNRAAGMDRGAVGSGPLYLEWDTVPGVHVAHRHEVTRRHR